MSSATKFVTIGESVSSGVGSIYFGTPEHITTDDTDYAWTSNGGAAKDSHYIVGYHCDFAIPAWSTINGIEVILEIMSDQPLAVKGSWRGANIRKADGTYGATDKAPAGDFSVGSQTVTLGSSTDLWDESWSAEDINSDDFGFRGFFLIGTGDPETPGGVNVEYMKITVYYTEGVAPGMSVNIGHTWKAIDWTGSKLNVGDLWKAVRTVKVNIADAWKRVYSSPAILNEDANHILLESGTDDRIEVE